MSSPLDRRRLSQIFVDFIYGQERASNNQQHTHTQNLLAKLNFFSAEHNSQRLVLIFVGEKRPPF